MAMTSDVDPRLVTLLRASFGFADALRDAGVDGPVSVTLGRPGGLSLLQLVAGSNDPDSEEFSQRNQPVGQEFYSLAMAGLSFRWPRPERALMHRQANDNCPQPEPRYGFEEETPALR